MAQRRLRLEFPRALSEAEENNLIYFFQSGLADAARAAQKAAKTVLSAPGFLLPAAARGLMAAIELRATKMEADIPSTFFLVKDGENAYVFTAPDEQPDIIKLRGYGIKLPSADWEKLRRKMPELFSRNFGMAKQSIKAEFIEE